MAKSLRPSKAPNIPIAPVAYDQRYQDQMTNANRLYFNQIDNVTSVLLGPSGGRFLMFPYGSFYDTTSQYDGSTTIPYAVRLNSTASSNDVYITSRTFQGSGSITLTTMTITYVNAGRLYPSMLLSGTGVTAGTYVYLQLSSTATVTATHSYAIGSGTGGVGTYTIKLDSVTNALTGVVDVEPRMFVSGTGVPANTRITHVDIPNKTITLDQALTVQAAGSYSFRPWGYEGTYSVSPSQSVAPDTIIYGDLPSCITPKYDGVYAVQFSLLLSNTDNNTVHDVDVWFRVNDVDVPDSNSQFSVPGKHTGVNGHLVAVTTLPLALYAGDFVEIVWHTDSSTVFIEYVPPQISPIRPAAPGAIATAQFISELP